MAAEIKGITIQLNGDTTNLQKALKDVRKEANAFDKELSYIDKSLKFNPKNIDLLKQKIAVLSDATAKGEKNIADMKKALADMKAAGVSETSAEYRELQREIIKAENKQKAYNAELKKLKAETSTLGQVSKKMEDFGNKATKAGQALKGVSMAAAGIDLALAGLAYKSGTAADELNTLSQVTGISTDQLQKYKAAADLTDVSVEAIAKSQQKLKKSMFSAMDGANAQAQYFEQLGIEITNADGSLRDANDVFEDTIAALGSMENETERDAIAMALLGKSATELNPLIEDNGETYKRVSQIFEDNGLEVVDEETLKRANDFNDSLDEIKATWGLAISTIGTQLAGYLSPIIDKVSKALEKVAGWLSKLSPQTLTIIGIIAAIVAGIAPLLIIIGKLAFAISSITGLLSTLGLSFTAIAGPIGIAIAAIGAIIAIGVLLYKNWDTIKAKAAELKTWVVDKWTTLKNNVISAVTNLKEKVLYYWEALKAGVSIIADSILHTLTHPFETAFNIIQTVVDKIKGLFSNWGIELPHIKLPHFSVSPPGWKIGDLLKGVLPSLGISWYKTGGIFDSPSVIGVGEAGPEAVIPIDKLRDILGGIVGPVINVYGAEGQNVNELADLVVAKLITEQNRRRLAW